MNALGGYLTHVYVPVTGRPSELLAGEPTSVPGLAVVPELTEDGTGFTGAWCVTHVGTGRAVSPPYGSPDEALRAAFRLGAVRLARWDRTPYAAPGREDEVAEMVRTALEPTLLMAG